MKLSVLALATCLALLTLAPAHAQNLVVNPNFDHDLSSWNPTNAAGIVTTTWSHRDADGSTSSGSLLSTNTASTAFEDSVTAAQCIDVVPGQKYYLRAKVLIPSGQTSTGQALISAVPGTGSCASPTVVFGGSQGFAVSTVGSWADEGKVITAPAGFGRIIVQLINTKTPAGGSLQMFFDDVSFAPTSTAPCAPSSTTLCIPGDGRFEVRVHYSSPSRGLSGDADAVSLASLGITQGGVFSFFLAANPEMLIKVLDGCSLNNYYWVFFAATTDVGFTVTVRDSVTGSIVSYTSPDHAAAPPMQATAALPCG